MKPLFISFLRYILDIHTNSFIHIHSLHSLSSAPVSSSLQAQVEGLHWGAEPGFELGATLQQPDTLPTEPCRTLNLSLSVWFLLSLKHWSPPNRQHIFLFSGFCDTSQRFSVQHSGSLNLHTLYRKSQFCFPKIRNPTFQLKNIERKKNITKAINHTVSSMIFKLDRTFFEATVAFQRKTHDTEYNTKIYG